MRTPRLLDVDGHTLAAFNYNPDLDSTPIVFIHGFTANIAFWERCQAPLIDKEFRWYSLSLPGHCPAVLPKAFKDTDLTADLFPEVLIPAIRMLVGDQPVILAGHSTGGFAALLIAEASPDMVKGVMCIGGFCNGNWGAALGKMQEQVRRGGLSRLFVEMQLRMLRLHPKILKGSLKGHTADFDAACAWPQIDAWVADNYVFTRHLCPNTMIHYLAQMPSIDVADRLTRITTPTLVLTGELDAAYPRNEAAYIHERLPNSQLVVLEGAGHLPMVERPREYQDAIADWLAVAQSG